MENKKTYLVNLVDFKTAIVTADSGDVVHCLGDDGCSVEKYKKLTANDIDRVEAGRFSILEFRGDSPYFFASESKLDVICFLRAVTTGLKLKIDYIESNYKRLQTPQD